MLTRKESPDICVIGLGYVGLPLAVALAKKYPVIGFDINQSRVEELHNGHDRTREIEEADLRSSSIHLTHQLEDIRGRDIYIVTVPTPIDAENKPDLTPLEKASEAVGSVMEAGSIVVYESTVYPGVTEDVCAPILEKASDLKSGKDFYLGYSPERINPGDKVHTVDKITKVVSGQTAEVCDYLAEVYGSMNDGNIFQAATIKTAEAAKVIENTQRDINIAFINEISGIFEKIGVSVHDVLEAAGSKWNFLNFKPGLVGGHCIGVDPYYLAHLSKMVDHEPEVILAGRNTNEKMSGHIARAISRHLHPNSKILVMGLTFKEDIPDLRNTKVTQLIHFLKNLGHEVSVHDVHADPEEAKSLYGLEIHSTLDGIAPHDCVVGAVRHKGYLDFTVKSFENILKPKGLVADIKNMWSGAELNPHYTYWRL